MNSAREKRCHYCSEDIEDMYVSISARYLTKTIYTAEMAFHSDCFNIIAGDSYTQQLISTISKATEKLKKESREICAAVGGRKA